MPAGAKTVVTIVGNRPQFIKMAAVSRALRRVLPEKVIHTGQHYDANMSDVFFRELDIAAPDYHLGIGSQSHGRQTGQMLSEIETLLMELRPALVLVYGDTNSTLAGALAAAKLHIPVAHVEAGFRSYNKAMPEEINRIMTDHAAALLFCSSKDAVENLKREGIAGAHVHHSGDVMYDAALIYGQRAEAESDVLQRLGLAEKSYLLCTFHRAENTDNPARLSAIYHALCQLAAANPVVLPLHPRTRKCLEEQGLLKAIPAGLHIIEPVGYLDMIMLEKHARLIATDSGGVQKEAFFYEVPCVTLRDETEYTELQALGWNKLVPPENSDVIVQAVSEAMGMKGRQANIYGEGRAAEYIAGVLQRFLA